MSMIDFPIALDARTAQQNLWLRGQSVSSGRGFDGRRQTVTSGNKSWFGYIDFTRLNKNQLAHALVFSDSICGDLHKFRIRIRNCRTLTYQGDNAAFYKQIGISEEEIARGGLPFSDGSYFSDGSGFAFPSFEDPKVMGDYSAGVTEIHLTGVIGMALAVASYFSHNGFLYRVKSNDGGRIVFNPPLRQSLSDGNQVDVSNPTILVRLAPDTSYRPVQNNILHGEASKLQFEEAFDR